MTNSLRIEVACALPHRQRLLTLIIAAPCSAREAVRRSGIAADFPEIDIDAATLGIWGKVLKDPDAATLRDGDRIEIYRPLLIDPKAVRKARAAARGDGPKRLRR